MKKGLNVFLGAILALLILVIAFYFYQNYKKIYKPKPGSCLILEEKYCVLAKINSPENVELTSISYKLPAGTALFSPIDSNYSAVVFKKNNGENVDIVTIGNQRFDTEKMNEDSRLWYQFTFRGKFGDGITSGGTEKIIKKGQILGYTSKISPKSQDSVYLVIKGVFLGSDGKIESKNNTEEMKKFLIFKK